MAAVDTLTDAFLVITHCTDTSQVCALPRRILSKRKRVGNSDSRVARVSCSDTSLKVRGFSVNENDLK